MEQNALDKGIQAFTEATNRGTSMNALVATNLLKTMKPKTLLLAVHVFLATCLLLNFGERQVIEDAGHLVATVQAFVSAQNKKKPEKSENSHQ